MLISITVNRYFMHICACILIVTRFLRFCKEFLGIPLKIYGTLKPMFCYFKPTFVQSLSYFQNSSNLYFSIYFKMISIKTIDFYKINRLMYMYFFFQTTNFVKYVRWVHYFVNLLFCDINLLITEMHD